MAVGVDELGLSGPLGDRVRWLVSQVAVSPPTTNPNDAAAAIGGDDPMGFLHWLSNQIAGCTIEAVEGRSDHEAVVRVVCPNGRRWNLAIPVEAEPPHRIGWVQLDRALPDGMEVREATPQDGDAIGEVCRKTEIVLRDSTVTIDPGSDYFAAIRMMEQATVLVATHDGRVVGVHCGARYPITYGGEPQYMSQILHSRVLAEYAGIGLWSVMNRRLVNAANAQREASARMGSETLNGCAYFSAENDAARRLNGAQSAWSFRPWRAVLSCAALAADATDARPATPADAAHIVDILNRCHADEELFRPYTVASFTARVERAPDVYSWSDVLVGETAVVGTWMAGRTHIRRHVQPGGARNETVSRRGLVLDYGFVAGHEDDFEALLRLAGRTGLGAGMTDLSVFSSDPSPGSARLRTLARAIEEYELSTPYTPEPEGATAGGLYVDQIYF